MKLTKVEREQLKQKFGGHCAYCGVVLGARWHADHLESIGRNFKFVFDEKKRCHVAKSDGTCLRPENDTIENLMPACIKCNINKHSMSLESWRTVLTNYINGLNSHAKYAMYQHAKRFGLVQETQKPVTFFFETYKADKP